MTYLAVPYSHPDPKIREARFAASNCAAYRLMQRGEVVFSPISHSHPIEAASGVIGDHEFWAKQDDAFQAHATKVAVLMIDGWKESRGVQREIKLAEAAQIPIEFLHPSFGDSIIEPKTAYQLAETVTQGARKDDYGDAYTNAESFAHILTGVLWRKLKRAISPREAFLCMIGGKLSRDGNKPLQDNLTDMIGYSKLIDEDPRFSK